MRPLLCALAALAASVPALAQPVPARAGFPVQKGSVSLDGSANVSSSRVGDGDRVTFVSVQPSALFFVADGLALGASASLSRSSFGDGLSATSYGVGPTAAYFFGGPGRTVYPFVSAGASVARSSFSGDPGLDSDATTLLGAEVSGGGVFMLSRTVGLSGEAYYQAQSATSGDFDDSVGANALGLRAGFVAFLF